MGKVLRAEGDLAVQHTGAVQRLCNADIHREYLCAADTGQRIDGCNSFGKVLRNGGSHVLRGLGHTLGNNAVVGAEDQHRFFAWGRHGIFADAGKLYDHIFQPSQILRYLA